MLALTKWNVICCNHRNKAEVQNVVLLDHANIIIKSALLLAGKNQVLLFLGHLRACGPAQAKHRGLLLHDWKFIYVKWSPCKLKGKATRFRLWRFMKSQWRRQMHWTRRGLIYLRDNPWPLARVKSTPLHALLKHKAIFGH